MSKRAEAIEVMNANAELPMADVVKLIAEKINVTEANAKSYYKWIVANGKAPGKVEKAVKSTRSAATPKEKTVKRLAKETVAKAKLIKPKTDMSFTKDRKPITDKTVEEINDIRAKNLARLKAVGKKYAKGQYAEPKAPGVPNFDADEAVAYVDAVTNDLDSFKNPDHLTADEVRALV